MTRPKADRQQTTHSSGPRTATTPAWRWSGRSSCAMVDLRRLTCGRRRESDPLRTLTTVFPWARWRNNDLWNLLPARGNISLSKSDRLPSSCAMANAPGRMLDWWENAWIASAREAQFFMEARYSLPGMFDDRLELEDIFLAALHQRARLRQDQQLVEWQAI